jgi:hypothetical protein
MSLAEKQFFLYCLLTHKEVEYYCPQGSDVSAFPALVMLNALSGDFVKKKNGEPVSLCHLFGLVA